MLTLLADWLFLIITDFRKASKTGVLTFALKFDVSGFIFISYDLINKVNKDSVSVQCNHCKSIGEIQLSNLYRHGYSCKSCNGIIKESNVYAFKINNPGGDYIKIGKSNSPYLRSLSFLEDCSSTSIEFICSASTNTEDEAYRFERYLKTKFKEFNIEKSLGKDIVDSGFTELYSTGILPELITSIKFYEECCFD